MLPALKSLLPDRPVPVTILRGPFRGARVVMNPRHSMRKILGLYEHENNAWLDRALRQVSNVMDVGANDGYFTFGCAAAFRRLRKQGRICAFEPEVLHLEVLRRSIAAQGSADARIDVFPLFVGRESREGMTTLDDLPIRPRKNWLVKIDVEGAEIDVIEGAQDWLDSSNLFIIEVHDRNFIAPLLEMFQRRGLELCLVDQRPLPILGRENRDIRNWWLVSRLPGR